MTRPSEKNVRAPRQSARWRLAVIAGVAGLVGGGPGCARPAGLIFESGPEAPVWPSPPDVPRVRYLGQLRTDQDLRPARGPGNRLGEFLFGKEPALGMLSPIGVCTDGGSRVFVADSHGRTLHVFDLDSRTHQPWRPGAGQPPFLMPVAVAVDPPGHEAQGPTVFVADSVAEMVFVFDADGKCTGTIGAGALARPVGIVAEPGDGRILVADSSAHQIVVFSKSGRELARLGRRGPEPGNFNFPTNLALDRAGRLYVSDTLNFRVQVFSPDLRPLGQFGVKGDMPGSFSQPKGIALDPDDHLYVVDANFEAVQVFDTDGRLLLSFGREGHGPGEFWLPAGMCIDPSGRIWIADTYNKRIQVFQYLTEDPSR
jgi:DNA-binding beta-propeller fold protein YncE